MKLNDMSELKLFMLVIGGCLLLAFFVSGCSDTFEQSNPHTEVVVICGKESVKAGDGHEYRVYTSNGTYVVKDYMGTQGSRFNSADLYGKIEVGETYRIESFGYRVPFFSSFWNISSIEKTDQKPVGSCG